MINNFEINTDKLKKNLADDLRDITDWGMGNNSNQYCVGHVARCQIQILVTNDEKEFLDEDAESLISIKET